MTRPKSQAEPEPQPSKITVPRKAHPAAQIVFAEMKRQGVTYDELEYRAGVLKSTFKAWRTHNSPGLESMQAALGALGWEFLPIPKLDHIPAEVRAKLAEAAEMWGSEDDLLCELIAMVAHSPAIDRALFLSRRPPRHKAPPLRRLRRAPLRVSEKEAA